MSYSLSLASIHPDINEGIFMELNRPTAWRGGQKSSEPADLKSLQLDRDGALEKFDTDDEKLLVVVCLEDQTFDTLERAVDDPGRFTDFRILELLYLHLRMDNPLDGVDLGVGYRNRFRSLGVFPGYGRRRRSSERLP